MIIKKGSVDKDSAAKVSKALQQQKIKDVDAAIKSKMKDHNAKEVRVNFSSIFSSNQGFSEDVVKFNVYPGGSHSQ